MAVNFFTGGQQSAATRGGYRMRFSGTMVIKRSDFGMPLSTVGDEVTLSLETEFLEPGMEHEWPSQG